MPSYRGLSSGNQLAPFAFNLQSRKFSTSGSAPDPENESAAPDVPPRIKFKRLDKTARHIMQAHSSPDPFHLILFTMELVISLDSEDFVCFQADCR